MNKQCPTYKNKGMYLLITMPLILLYFAVGYYLWNFAHVFFWIYLALFILTNVFQSYCCAFQKCPYIHGFCPGIGGFIIPSSRIARLFENKATSKSLFQLSAVIASVLALGIIILPLFFLKDLGILFILLYCLIFIAYGELFLNMICPDCITKKICPAGLLSSRIILGSDTSDISSDPGNGLE